MKIINIVLLQSLILLYLILNNNQYLVADILYQEGFYDYDNLPGGYLNKERPNLPFSTDTNRLSDGFTSTDAIETTSSRFPLYIGSLANVTDRYLRYLNYIESAAQQGISPYGAGDEEREQARLKIVQQVNYTDIAAPNKTFTVYAAIKWNPSDYAIQEGETYFIEVQNFENQFWYDGGIKVNAEGYSSYFDSISNCYVALGRCRSHLKKRRRLTTANWMSLSCAIGQFVRPLVEIEPGKESEYRWLPLEESELQETIFNVGRSVRFRSSYTGQLICFANDAHTTYWNNYGEILVTVVRVSWPPSNTSIYEDSLLPSCDSARVVYVNKGINTGPGKVPCNPNGGGAGWALDDILNTKGGYGSGAPEDLFYDLPAYARGNN